MNKDITVEPFGHNLLHELAGALKETDWAVCLGEAVVRAAGLVEDNNGALVPRVGAAVECRIEDVGEGIWPGGVGPSEDGVTDSAGARRGIVGRGFEGRGDLGGSDGRPVVGNAGRGVSVLDGVDWQRGARENAGLEDVGLEGRVVDQGAVGGLEGWEGLDLSSVVGLGEAPDVAVLDGVVEAVIGPRAFGLLEGLMETPRCLHAARVGGGEAGGGVCEVTLLIPPRQASR